VHHESSVALLFGVMLDAHKPSKQKLRTRQFLHGSFS
jgi:hypothetical protein